jgi:hypothetical protein
VSFPGESFWVVVGTAAPVIALAAVVSATDLISVTDSFDRPDDIPEQAWPGELERQGRRVVNGAWAVVVVVLLSQVLVLNLALGSLARGYSVISPDPVWIFEPVIIALLLGAATLNNAARTRRSGIDKALKKQRRLTETARPPKPSPPAGDPTTPGDQSA